MKPELVLALISCLLLYVDYAIEPWQIKEEPIQIDISSTSDSITFSVVSVLGFIVLVSICGIGAVKFEGMKYI